MGGTRSAKKKTAPSKKRPRSSHAALLPEETELVSLLPFSPARKRARVDIERCDDTLHGSSAAAGVAQRARLPGCLPSAAAAVPGVREATSVRLAASSLAWARRQACGGWFPVIVETETFESDGRVVVLNLIPPHARESLLVDNVQGHSDATDWQSLRDQTLRALAPEGTGAIAAYTSGVEALLRKHAKSQEQQQQRLDSRGSGHTVNHRATAASASSPTSLYITGRPLRIGGVPCVVMDSHSRLPMKLRHRVLGKLVEVLHAAGTRETIQGIETATDEIVYAGRVYEAELYRGASSKSEYQNKATSKIRSLRSEKERQLEQSAQQQTRQTPHVPRSGAIHTCSSASNEYELQPEQLLLSAADLALNLFPMTPDMVARAEQEMKAAGINPGERLVRSGEYDPSRGWRRPAPPLFKRKFVEPVMVAIDCEMVDTTGGHELARLSVVDAHCETLADVLVKPPNPIVDYLTQWSGITEELLVGVTTTLADAQDVLLRVVDADCILVGHSLENDLRAMKIAHDRVIDTSVCFPRRNGGGGKQALRALADRMLNLQIQTAGDDGHNSTEDASTSMRLALLRLRFGHDDVRIHNYARSRARIEAGAISHSSSKNSAKHHNGSGSQPGVDSSGEGASVSV